MPESTQRPNRQAITPQFTRPLGTKVRRNTGNAWTPGRGFHNGVVGDVVDPLGETVAYGVNEAVQTAPRLTHLAEAAAAAQNTVMSSEQMMGVPTVSMYLPYKFTKSPMAGTSPSQRRNLRALAETLDSVEED